MKFENQHDDNERDLDKKSAFLGGTLMKANLVSDIHPHNEFVMILGWQIDDDEVASVKTTEIFIKSQLCEYIKCQI